MEQKYVYVVLQYENYGNRENYTPYKKAFLTEQEVKDFLHKRNAEENSQPMDRKQFLNSEIEIEQNLSFREAKHYGDYHWETEKISLIHFNY